MKENRAAERETFKKKMVVESTHFKINTKMVKTHQRDKYHDLREDPVKKYGYKLPTAVIKKMNKRQVSVKKGISNPPVSMISDSQMEWKSPVPIHTIDFGKTPKK